ncbi:MAG TPA: CHRD domain-containing protein [Ramlibacter sp.]|nr:CHRD domain-containing protein [Ramlibacter sp.]
MIRRSLALAAGAGLLAGCAMFGGGGSAVKLGGTLSGAQEVPPVTTSGSGTVEATFDKQTNKLTYRVVYQNLSGPATAGHFHGPAPAGQNAGVVHGFQNAASPIQGEATLTAAQAADLLAGRWYVNIHTRQHPGGEIRAQVTAR